MTLNLFDTNKPKPKVDYLAEVKLRLEKLQVERTFINSNGTNITTRIIYTLPMTCTHQIFDHINREYKCRVKDCPGIITEKQINISQ